LYFQTPTRSKSGSDEKGREGRGEGEEGIYKEIEGKREEERV
jgi:hypothetical protein